MDILVNIMTLTSNREGSTSNERSALWVKACTYSYSQVMFECFFIFKHWKWSSFLRYYNYIETLVLVGSCHFVKKIYKMTVSIGAFTLARFCAQFHTKLACLVMKKA